MTDLWPLLRANFRQIAPEKIRVLRVIAIDKVKHLFNFKKVKI